MDPDILERAFGSGPYGSKILSPNFRFFLIYYDNETDSFKYYKTNLYEAYATYLSNKYPMFHVLTQECNLMDFRYPVPVPNLSTTFQLVLFPYIVNIVMNESEREEYLQTKKIHEAKLQELINRVITREEDLPQELITRFSNAYPTKRLTKENFSAAVISDFTHTFNYVELTKKPSVD